MKAPTLNRHGKSDPLAFADNSRPRPQADEILVKVHAVGHDPIDYMLPKGTFKPILECQLPARMAQLAEISKLLDASHIQPVIDRVFPFDQTLAALAYLKEGSAKGKVVVQLDSRASSTHS
ncbi:MAG TPA: zinc-binding dehydrogenase [Methylophilaceae bacterium]|nr:zinc-binding dehydrogenase [Methylophilaceae bacterium]